MTQEAVVNGGSALTGALRRYWVIILVAGFTGASLGYTLSSTQPIRYTADARLVLSKVVPFDPLGNFANADAQRFIGNQLSIITSGPVLEAAAQGLPEVEVEALRETVTATGGADQDVITVLATAPTAEQAKARADAVVNAYEAFRLQQVTEQTSDALAQTTGADRQSTIRVQASTYGNGVSLVQPAVLPETPSGPLPRRDAFVLAMAFGLLALGFALLRGSRTTNRPGVETGAARAGVPVLAQVTPPTRRVPAHGSASTEPLRMLLVTLDYLGDGRIRRLLLTSDVDGDATATASALARVAAEQGMQVLLVDGYGSTRHPESSLPDASDTLAWEPGTVKVLQVPTPGGTSRGPGGRRLAALLADTGGHADLTIIDAPPIRRSAEGFSLVAAADAVLLLLRETAPAEAVLLTQERLTHTGKGLLGVVVLSDRRKGARAWLRSRRPRRFNYEPVPTGTASTVVPGPTAEAGHARPSVPAPGPTSPVTDRHAGSPSIKRL